jgi:hypothetical protein
MKDMKKLMIAVLGMAVAVGVAVAGNMTPPGAPSGGSQMYTLQNLYDYLTSGTALSVAGSFQEPSEGPAATMKSTRQIGDDVKALFDQCDATADDVATGKKFFSTISGNWGVKTGTSAGGGILRTGQTTSYYTGDDGYYQAGTAFSYTDNADGTVTDNVTGLMWAMDGSAAGCAGGDTLNWTSAIDWAEGLVFAGYSDWRMPNVMELDTTLLRDAEHNDPFINTTYFPNTASDYYLSSTTYAAGDGYVYCARYDISQIETFNKENETYVRAIRGGQTQPTPTPAPPTATPTITPTPAATSTPTFTPTPGPSPTPGGPLIQIGSVYVPTGLSNAGTYNNGTLSHPSAVSWAAGLDYAGYSSGWRIGNNNEMQAICDDKDRLDGYAGDDHWTSELQAEGRYYTVRFGESLCGLGDDPEDNARKIRAIRDTI